MKHKNWTVCCLKTVVLLVALAWGAVASVWAERLCDVRNYGAKGDGVTKDTLALQKAIDGCAQQGGGVVRLAGGTFLTAPIELKSRITLEVAADATLLGSQDVADYPETVALREKALMPLIRANNAESITIRGGGVIDGAGKPWWDAVYSRRAPTNFTAARRPRLVLLDHCKHVLIENITLQNSASWQLVPYYCDDVTVRNARILAPARSANTDGIDPFSSTHVTISHVLIDTGDDNIAIKSGQPGSDGPDAPTTDVTIEDCVFLHGHGMSIGSEIAGGVQRVKATKIRFKDTTQGVRVKSGRDRGGDIGDFEFSDIVMENVKLPIQITAYYPRMPQNDTAQPVTRLTPRFHDIRILNLTATGARQAASIISIPESPLTTLVLDNVKIDAKRGMQVGNATIAAHNLEVTAAEGEAYTLLPNAKIERK
jgi:polygalacturonase